MKIRKALERLSSCVGSHRAHSQTYKEYQEERQMWHLLQQLIPTIPISTLATAGEKPVLPATQEGKEDAATGPDIHFRPGIQFATNHLRRPHSPGPH